MFIFNLNVVFTMHFLKICFYRGKINQVGSPVSKNPVFPHVVSCNEIALQEILLLEKSWAKAHTAKQHF
jgi:hypothetical protein